LRPGPSSSGPGPARPVRATTKAGPARPVVLRPGPFRSGKFPKLSLKCLRIVFYLFIFYRNICFSGYFHCIIYVFIVLSMFRETFRKFSSLYRGKATRGIDLDTQHDLLETNRNGPGRAGPGLNLGARPGPGPARQENWNFQARPGPARGPPGSFNASIRGVIRDAMPAAIPAVIDTGIAADIFCPQALPRTLGGIAAGNTSD
jgi:hypothetical protein